MMKDILIGLVMVASLGTAVAAFLGMVLWLVRSGGAPK